MTPIDPAIWNVLERTTKVAHIMNINEISLEDSPRGNLIRGFDASHGAPVVINHIVDDEDLELPFSALAINDCTSFVNKAKLALSRDDTYRTNIEINANTKQVDSINFKGKRFKLEFQAGKASTIRAPKAIKDTVAYTFKIEPQDMATLSQSVKALGGEDVTLVCDGTSIFYEAGEKKDKFSMVLCEEFEAVDGANSSFVFSYPFKTFYPVVSNCESCTFSLTTRGMLNCEINGINVYVIPRIA